jgi:hypothetical protein
MNDNLLRIRTLTDKFFDGDTTPEEEQELYAYYRQPREQMPDDLRSNCDLFRDLAALTSLSPTKQQTAPQHRQRTWWLAAAAVVLILIVGGTTLYHYRQADECVAYIYGERVTDRDVVLGEMQKTMTAMTADGSDVVEEQLKSMFGDND